jgi:hypothetical protein
MNRITVTGRIVAVAAALLILPWIARADSDKQAAPSAIEVRFQNDIPYVSGGVGNREQKAIERIAHDFSLMMTFAIEKGNYLGAGHVVITDAGGKAVVDATSRGPLFVADVPPGQYTVTATGFENKRLTRTVEILRGERRVLHFTWEK